MVKIFYIYRQNNTGGYFTWPAINIVVEAESDEQANSLAVSAGAYFNFDHKNDCECCGKRWSTAESSYKYLTLESAVKDIGCSLLDDGLPNYIVVKNNKQPSQN